MSDTNATEPTMEEILASIRRIISEDEAPAAAEPSVEAEEPEPPTAPAPAEEVLELTQRVEAPPPPPPAAAAPPAPPAPAPAAQTLGDLDVSDLAPPPPPVAPPAPRSDDGGLVGQRAAAAAASHFGQLAQTIAMPAPGRTLEDVVRDLLNPLLAQWLDEHLPRIVETAVQAEVERISRRH